MKCCCGGAVLVLLVLLAWPGERVKGAGAQVCELAASLTRAKFSASQSSSISSLGLLLSRVSYYSLAFSPRRLVP